jgi:hypothetical protein
MTEAPSEQAAILAFLQEMLPHWPVSVLRMIAVNEISARAAVELAETVNEEEQP